MMASKKNETPVVSPDTASGTVAKAEPEVQESNYQNYYLPEYGVTVKARTQAEAISKATKQGENE